MPMQKDSAHPNFPNLASRWEGGDSDPEATETVHSDDLLNEVLRLRQNGGTAFPDSALPSVT